VPNDGTNFLVNKLSVNRIGTFHEVGIEVVSPGGFRSAKPPSDVGVEGVHPDGTCYAFSNVSAAPASVASSR
jgi:hypothetical protein